MANFFDRFDAPAGEPAVEPSGAQKNFFDQFDAPVAKKPIAKAAAAAAEPDTTTPGGRGVGTVASDYAKIIGAELTRLGTVPEAAVESGLGLIGDIYAPKPSDIPRQVLTPESYLYDPEAYLLTGRDAEDVEQAKYYKRRREADEAIKFVKDTLIPDFVYDLSKGSSEKAKAIRESISPELQEKIKGSEIKGNLFEALKNRDFSDLSFGDNPNLEGYFAQGIQVLGSLIPVVATAVLTKSPTAAGVVGGEMAAAEAVDSAKQYIASKNDADLIASSPYYAQMRREGISEKDAREAITANAAGTAAYLQGLVATFGGAFTGKLVTGKFKPLNNADRSRLTRIAAGTGVGALEEGTQEFLEGIASDYGIDRSVVKEIGEDSFANLILGALGGAPVGAYSGARTKTQSKALSSEDKAIADLDKLAADEEAEAAQAGTGPLISEADLFPEESGGEPPTGGAGIPPEDTVPATLEELKKIDKDLKKKLGRAPTTAETEKALYDFEQEKTRRLRAESGGREPAVSVPSGEEAAPGVTGAPTRIEPTGLGAVVEPTDVAGARKEPTFGALAPTPTATTPSAEDPSRFFVFREMFRYGGESPNLQNYFKTYFGLPAKSLPDAAGKLMPLLERAESLFTRYRDVLSNANQPFSKLGPESKAKKSAARQSEYGDVEKYLPSGEVRRLANTAMAIDKNYKTKGNNPERFAKEIAEFEERLNKLEDAISKLPPPLTDEERQTREADYDALTGAPIDMLGEIMNGIRRGITAPSDVKPAILGYGENRRKFEGLGELIASDKTTYEELDNLENAFVEKYKRLVAEGKVSQEALDFVQERSKRYFEGRAKQAAPTGFPSITELQEQIDALPPVPTFTPPSTAAEKREAKAKKERSKAIAKMAAELGGTTDEEGGFRPAKDEEDSYFETIKAKAGANVRRLSKLLGPKLYGEPSEMPFVSVKEMVQNAFDAIKPMQEKGQLVKGKIDITVDKEARIISVTDNGTGMSPETLSTTFLTIAGTKKEGERDSGGLGIAKMQFLFNNEYIRVITMRDGVASELKSDGATLEESMEDPSVSPDITVYKRDNIPYYIKQRLPEGHGTYVEVMVPESYRDTSTGEDVKIDIPDYYSDYTVLKYSPLFGDINVEFNGRQLDIGSKFPYEDYTTFANVTFDWGVARIYVQKEPERYIWGENTSILSNGLWQFNVSLEVNDQPIPRRIYVDVSPKKEVKPEDARYPFDLNRQRFSPAVEKSFKQIFNYLRLAYRAADFASDVDNFGNIQYLGVDPKGKVTASPLEKLAPTLASDIFTATDISQGDQVQVKDGVLYVKGRAVRELTDADMKSATIDVSELKIDESKIPKDQVVLHINAGVPNVDKGKVSQLEQEIRDIRDEMWDKYGTTLTEKIDDATARAEYKEKLNKLRSELKKAEAGEVTSIAEIGREKFGAKFDEFLFEIGDAFLKLRNFAATLDPSFEKFMNEAVGVSLDDKYRGVSIKIPFSGVFINPFAPQFANLTAATSGTWGTMVHELAHVNVRDHGGGFASEMQKITLLLEASELEGSSKWADIKDQITIAFRKYKDVFQYFNKELMDGNLKPIGKRLSDSSEEQIGDAGDTERVAGFRGATEGEPNISGRSDLSTGNIGEERERARDAGEATTTDYEQRIIELGLKAGDINPAMVSAIANNDLNGALRIAVQKLSGFSSDLARALLELKLPSNISFNTGRELVRRSIDDVSKPQQARLFRYVQMHYPQVYDKYFKNYDRSESLESVAEGLIELQKPNYRLGPVIAEFGDVAGAYKKFIEGLITPGAYYPRFDEISLNTDTLTGKSYRVFLHEVVHAATEYVLNTYGTNPEALTPGQQAAAKELTAMYDYAVEKLGKTPYGMTNIYEFVAEVFTNKKFQDLLKGIKYEPKKAPFFTRLVRSILKAFGLDNLAGNAMAEATKIFSSVRTTTPLSLGPRFAKTGPKQPRIRGPVSQNWRTAEDVNAGMIGMFNDALKGRRSWGEVLKVIGPSMWDSGTGVFRNTVLGFLNLRQIDDLTKTKFPQISGAIRTIEQMLAYRGNIMKSAEDTVKKWTKAQAKKPKQGQLLARIMLEATIRGIDPDKPGTKQLNAAMIQAWNRLDPEFKEIYREVRDFYKRAVNNMVREMKTRVAKSNGTLAEKKAAIREINDKFGPDKLVEPYFPLRRFGKYWFQVGERNNKEFYEFEDRLSRNIAMRNRRNELRRGNIQQQALANTVEKGNGISEIYSKNIGTTQVLKEAQAIIDNITATSVGDAKKEMKDSLNQLIYILLPQQSMRKMFINRKAIQGASSDMLRVFASSAVHSAYQQSRFKFADAFINNLQNAREYVSVKSGFTAERSEVYKDYIQEVERRAPTILSNEDTSLTAVAAGKASELTFFYMLSAPFSAMLNVLGVAQIAMPYIGGRYGFAKTNVTMIKNLMRYLGTAPRRSLLPLAQGKFMDVSFPSIVEGATLSPILNRAAQRFIEEGQINISLTNDLMDMGGQPSSLYTGRYNMVKKMLSGLFHQSERLGREVVLLSTFELAYDKFSKSPKKDLRGVIERDAKGNPVMNTADEAFELAIAEAKDMAGLALGDFTRQMKPRYFTPPLLSVITKFKQYSVLATYAVIRNFYFTVAAPLRKTEIEEFRQQMIKDGVSQPVIDQRIAEADAQRKELYREGRRRLAGILAITYLLGGNEASPFYSIGIGMLVKLLGDDDDDEFFDWENWVKNYMENELGGAAGDLFAEMGMNPETAEKAGKFVGGSLQRGVVSELTGGELSGRVSLDPKNMWYREGGYSPDIRESIVDDVIANSGPVVGLGFNWIEAYKLFQEGKYQRAFEKAAPAIVSKPVAAARVAEEDARTASGYKLADNFSAWELAMLSIGLQPTRLAQAQKSAIETKTYEEKVKARRDTLLDRLWLERNNSEGFNSTLEKIQDFSLKYPTYAITGEAIKDSFKKRGANQALAETIGAQVDKRSIPKALEMLRYGRPD